LGDRNLMSVQVEKFAASIENFRAVAEQNFGSVRRKFGVEL